MSGYALGIDIGTTSVKAVLLSSNHEVAAEASCPHDLISLKQNWAEENADVWWQGVREAIGKLKKEHPEKTELIKCIGCSGMVPAIVLLDGNGRPLRNTIQQNDARAIKQVNHIRSKVNQDEIFQRTGSYVTQQHILPRLLWVKENEPEIWKSVHSVTGSYEYISYLLTGSLYVEVNWAAESGCYDIRNGTWIDKLPEQFGIKSNILPAVKKSDQIIGYVKKDISTLLGIPAGIPVVAGCADHVASAFASGIVNHGDLLIKFGGAGDILYCADGIVTHPKLFFDYHIVPEKSLPNGCMATSGSLVKWFVRDIMGMNPKESLKLLDKEAEKIAPTGNGIIVLPYFLGEKTPLFDPEAKGVFYGLNLSHTKYHLYRAVLESVVYGFRHHIDELKASGEYPNKVIASDGGAKSALWCSIAASILEYPIHVYKSQAGSSVGAAFVAGKACGLFQTWDEIICFLKDEIIYQPDEKSHQTYDQAYEIYRELYTQLQPCLRKSARMESMGVNQ